MSLGMPREHRIIAGLDTVLHIPERQPFAWVVCLHGLESNKDGAKYFALADRLVAAGIGVVRFDFRGCGASTGRFEDTNVATRLADARAIFTHLQARPGGHQIGLFGSSMGGYVALWLAQDAQVQAVVGLAAPHTLHDWVQLPAEQSSWLRAFIAEYVEGTYRSVPAGATRVLLLHGTADKVVPVQHAYWNWARLAEPRHIRVFENGDHRFSQPEHLAAAVDEASAWFVRWLKPSQ